MLGETVARGRPFRTAAAAVLLAVAAGTAHAGSVPVLVSAGGSAGHIAYAGGPVFGAALSVPGSASPGFDPDFTPSVLNFPSGSGTGSSTARVGLSHAEGQNAARVFFASGTGVSQSDPGNARGSSSLELQFGAVWRITDGNDFGPPILTGFSLPVGMRVGAGGSASVIVEVHWGVTTSGGMTINDAREPYLVSQTFGPGVRLTSFVAPASPFAFTSLDAGDTIQVTGTLLFRANNETTPSMIELPTAADFPEFVGAPELTMIPGAGLGNVADVLPEPAAAGLLAVGAVLAVGRRRRRQSRRPAGTTGPR